MCESPKKKKKAENADFYSVLKVFGKREEADGVDSDEDPPVPILNTEVKLTCADNIRPGTAWEEWRMGKAPYLPFLYG